MIKNGKIYVHPLDNDADFKETFQLLTTAGAGRTATSDGVSPGPWTPELIAAEITKVDQTGEGADLRSVQNWFQDNDRGISATNILLLAKVFGCDDPKLSSLWQTELTRSVSRLATKRRSNLTKKSEPRITATASRSVITQVNATNEVATQPRRSPQLGDWTASQFTLSPLHLPSAVFAGATLLGLSSIFLGIHNLTIADPTGITKQLGYLWSPNWTILFLILLPLFLYYSSNMLSTWQSVLNENIQSPSNKNYNTLYWDRESAGSSSTYWVAFIVCIPFMGVVQWIAVRLLPLLQGQQRYALDWGTISITNPEIVSIGAEILFTASAYLYMATCFYLLSAGNIITFTIVKSYSQTKAILYKSSSVDLRIIEEDLMAHIFKCSLICVLIAICMKAQSSYLASSSTDILNWFFDDVTNFYLQSRHNEIRSLFVMPNHYTSLLVVLLSFVNFIYGHRNIADRSLFQPSTSVYLLLICSYLTIDAFTGFSLLLLIGVIASIVAIAIPSKAHARITRFGDDNAS